jgi:hypothetical protein
MIGKQDLRFHIPVVLCLGFLLFYCSANINQRDKHRGESINKEMMILEGKPYVLLGQEYYFPEFQNRVIFALSLKTLSRSSLLSVEGWYLFLRIIFAVACVLLFYYACRSAGGCPSDVAVAGCGVLVYGMILAFNHPWEHPTDFLDVIFFTIFIALTIKKKALLLLLFALAAAGSRESCVFAGVIWAIVNGLERRKWSERIRVAAVGFGISLLSYCAVIGLRYWFGGPHGIARLQQMAIAKLVDDFVTMVVDRPSPFVWPVLAMMIIALPVLWMFHNRGMIKPVDRRLMLATAVITLLIMVPGDWHELRTFIPSIVLLSYTASSIAASRHADQ